MVFVADDLTEFGTLDNGVADEALGTRYGFDIENADTWEIIVVLSAKEVAEELVKAADC